MFENYSLGERLSLLRKSKNITQKDIAEIVGLTDKTVSKWEVGDTMPSVDEIKKLSVFFNISFDFILNGQLKNNEDNEVAKSIIKWKNYETNKQEVVKFLKLFNIKGDINNLFNVTDEHVYANLDNIVKYGNFELFKQINLKYDFIKTTKACNTKQKNQTKAIILPHPYKLLFDDIKGATNIEFYQEAFNNFNSISNQLNRETEETMLASALESVSFVGDEVYSIIIYLIDNGAKFITKQPFEHVEGYQQVVDTFKTNFVYKQCKDMLEIKKQICLLKNITTQN